MKPARLRSVLYVPAANTRALEKARGLPADALILDLEDAVAPAAKAEARERVRAVLARAEFEGKFVAVRVNGRDTEWHHEDVAAIARSGPDAIVIPKVSSPNDVLQVQQAISAVRGARGLDIWAMIETPAAVLGVAAIARASERLKVLVVGTNDLTKELGAGVDEARTALLASLSLCMLGARAAGRMILDGVYNDVHDAEGFARECRQGRLLGFDGKTLIHPDQVNACNEAWSPSASQLAHAREVISAFDEAERDGSGVAVVDGQLVENLHVEMARKLLALAGES